MKRSPAPLLLLLAYLGFISLGLPDAALGVAWPSLRQSFLLPQSGLGLVLAAGSSGYFTASFNAGRLIGWLGIGRLLAGSTLLVALAVTLYALSPAWPIFLLAAALVGSGSGAIDAGLNAYAAHRFSGRQMNWLHASFGVGAMSGPLIMTAALTAGRGWRVGYGVIALIMALMGTGFLLTRHRWRERADGAEEPPPGRWRDALGMPVVWMQVGIFLLYTGIEFAAGQWAFTLLTTGRGLAIATAGLMVGLYWGALALGRLLFGFAAGRLSLESLVRAGMVGTLLGALLVAAQPLPLLSAAGLLLMGFALAPIFPCLMSLTPERVGAGAATHAVGFQVSAAVAGGVLLPGLIGLVLQATGSPESIPAGLIAGAALMLAAHERLLRRAPVIQQT